MTETKEPWSLVRLKKIGDPARGFLSPVETQSDVPFKINRVYFIYGANDPKAERGGHSHLKTEQVFFCVTGQVAFHLDDGENQQDIFMGESPNIGLYIPPGVWHTMDNFSHSTVIVALASERYNESDYIRSYDEFLKKVSKHA